MPLAFLTIIYNPTVNQYFHVMVGSALLTAYKNAGGEIDLSEALLEMMNRGKAVPGGVCGFWGACGAGISTGMFISIISGATPLKNEPPAFLYAVRSAEPTIT